MIKILSLALFALSLTAAPIFPDFSKDGYSIKGSDFIGVSITSPGRYLFALEDLPVNGSGWTDFDYNDLYGEVEWYGGGFYKFTVQGGLGAYFNNGTAGFSGSLGWAPGDPLTLIFNTPTGQMYSGTPQVLIYQLEIYPTPAPSIPEPGTYALVGASILALIAIRHKKGAL